MNIANVLTSLRIILTLFFIQTIFQPGVQAKFIAACIFLAAALTDFFDGYFARKYNLITDFGKILDPIADKFLVLVAFYAFASLNIIPWWMVVVIFIREIGITLVRFFAMNRKIVLAAESLGKYKTVTQMVSIFVILIFLVVESGFSNQTANVLAWYYAIDTLMILTILLTVISGYSFLKNNREHLHVG